MFIVYRNVHRQFIVAPEHEKEFIQDLARLNNDVTDSNDWNREEVTAPYIEVEERQPSFSW